MYTSLPSLYSPKRIGRWKRLFHGRFWTMWRSKLWCLAFPERTSTSDASGGPSLWRALFGSPWEVVIRMVDVALPWPICCLLLQQPQGQPWPGLFDVRACDCEARRYRLYGSFSLPCGLWWMCYCPSCNVRPHPSITPPSSSLATCVPIHSSIMACPAPPRISFPFPTPPPVFRLTTRQRIRP